MRAPSWITLVAQGWQVIDLRGALAGRSWAAGVAIGSLAVCTALAMLMHVGVSVLEVELQRDFADELGDVVQVEMAPTAHAGEAAVHVLDRALGSLRRSVVEQSAVRMREGERERVVPVIGTSWRLPQLQHTTMRAGRWFTARDEQDARHVVVLGRTLVDSMYRGLVPRRVRFAGRVFDVIGVAESGAVSPVTLDQAIALPRPLMRRVVPNRSGTTSLLVGAPRSVSQADVYDVWRRLSRTTPRLRGQLVFSSARERLGEAATLSEALRAAAIGLSAVLAAAALVAVTALMSTIARAHARLVGVTRALGATRRHVATYGVLIGAVVGAVGVGGGVILAIGGSRVLPLLFDVSAPGTSQLLTAVMMAAPLPMLVAVVVSALCFMRIGRRAPAHLLA